MKGFEIATEEEQKIKESKINFKEDFAFQRSRQIVTENSLTREQFLARAI